MSMLVTLWLPILLSAVAVFIVSSIIHTVLPWHKRDYAGLPSEDRVLDALRSFAIQPGDYMAPKPASMDDFKSPEFAAKAAKGPRLVMTVMRPGPISMGSQLGQWFVYLVVVSGFAACIAGSALQPGAEAKPVFHYVSLAAFGGYAIALWQMSIWYQRSWLTTVKATIDGLIYACVTAGIFVWLWPK